MSDSPTTFVDPQQRPVRFVHRIPKPILAFGESSFPVSFSFERSPRPAVFLGATALQLGTYLVDADPYGGDLVQLAIGQSQSISLMATGSDVTSASFFLRTTRTDGSVAIAEEWSVMGLRQPSFTADVAHQFLTDDSAKNFDSIGGLYPAATMNLTIHRLLSSGLQTISASTDKDDPTDVVLAPSGSYGVVDVEIDVVVSWYTDEARTIPAAGPTVSVPRLGLRLYVSSGSRLSRRITIGSSCVVSSLYPTTVLQGLGGEDVSLAYWGSGSDGIGLFWGFETGIEVSSNGLPLQSGIETASYILSNELVDHDTSSSSSSSPSSLNSTSSMLDVRSSSSVSSLSSKSSSSTSSWSTSSSTLSSLSSPSSPSSLSSSSSTAVLDLSSSSVSSVSVESSESSGSSLTPTLLAMYGFDDGPDEFGKIYDDSPNGRNLSMAIPSSGLGPPTWGATAGVSGGGFVFVADNTHTDYMQASADGWLTDRGSIHMWVKPSRTTLSSLFCISNGFVEKKTELVVATIGGALSAWLTIDGVVLWRGKTADGLIPTNSWSQVAVINDGTSPAFYVNGLPRVVTFDVSVDTAGWSSRMATATSAPSKVVVGGAPRYYSPFMTLGFSGSLDELSVWDEALSAGDIAAMFASV